MPRVVHFEINVEDVDRAIKFYSEVLGWKFEKWDGPMEYWMITTGSDDEPGINGGLTLKGTFDNLHTVMVSSVDEYISKVLANGGELAGPKMAIPGMGYLAYVKDPEGNLFGIMDRDENAA